MFRFLFLSFPFHLSCVRYLISLLKFLPSFVLFRNLQFKCLWCMHVDLCTIIAFIWEGRVKSALFLFEMRCVMIEEVESFPSRSLPWLLCNLIFRDGNCGFLYRNCVSSYDAVNEREIFCIVGNESSSRVERYYSTEFYETFWF